MQLVRKWCRGLGKSSPPLFQLQQLQQSLTKRRVVFLTCKLKKATQLSMCKRMLVRQQSELCTACGSSAPSVGLVVINVKAPCSVEDRSACKTMHELRGASSQKSEVVNIRPRDSSRCIVPHIGVMGPVQKQHADDGKGTTFRQSLGRKQRLADTSSNVKPSLKVAKEAEPWSTQFLWETKML